MTGFSMRWTLGWVAHQEGGQGHERPRREEIASYDAYESL